MMNTVLRNIFLKQMLITIKDFIIFIVICHFASKKMKIKRYNKLVSNLYDKKDCVVHIRALKQALYHDLVLKKIIQ